MKFNMTCLLIILSCTQMTVHAMQLSTNKQALRPIIGLLSKNLNSNPKLPRTASPKVYTNKHAKNIIAAQRSFSQFLMPLSADKLAQKSIKQQTQNKNLTRIWTTLEEYITITHIMDVASQEHIIIPQKGNSESSYIDFDKNAKNIRNWLNKKENKMAIELINQLDLSGLNLTCLPEELSLFTNLQYLYLGNNKLISIKIPETLTNLRFIELDKNELTSIFIPKNLSKLEALNLSNNQLTFVDIPNTLTNLSSLDIRNNKLLSLVIPATLKALHLTGDNKLAPIIIRKHIQ